MANEEHLQDICSAIEDQNDALHQISDTLWKNPELSMAEHRAHDLLTRFLEQHEFVVQRKAYLPTAFVATFCSPNYKLGPNVAILCEYDALPELGHGCGHNLIAEVGIGAAVGLISVLRQSKYGIDGKLTVLGTPAEESQSGKVQMIRAGAFKDVDLAMMAHPATANVSKPKLVSYTGLIVTYHGRPSHACAAPWAGRNALDAAVMAYQGLAVLRQHIKPDWRISAIITQGGAHTSIIPQHTEVKVSYRTLVKSDNEILHAKVEACLRAAAMATGCQVRIERDEDHMLPMIHNQALAAVYENNCGRLHIPLSTSNEVLFSTDMGDVSHVVPSIHPVYEIGAKGPNHTTEFTRASGDVTAQHSTLDQAKCLALTALDVIMDSALLCRIQEEFTISQSNE